MYKVRYMPYANDDLRKAITYILDKYEDTAAATALTDDIIRQIDTLAEFPYAHPLYHAKMKLPSEIRFFPVFNHIVFYAVIEPDRVVEVRRIRYEKMDITQQDT